MSHSNFLHVLYAIGIVGALSIPALSAPATAKRPNILLAITDDQSAISTGIAGDPLVKTPTFDRIAREGVLFTNAHCSASSCSPSRASLLTGRNQWELREASVIACGFPGDLTVYQDLLWEDGYFTGYVGKGFGPGVFVPFGRKTNPAGIDYNKFRNPRDSKDFRDTDYVANFQEFLRDRNPGQPFSCWFGSFDPHRPYDEGIGVRSGLDPAKVFVPPSMMDYPGMREDLCDYLYEIQRFDKDLGTMLELLEKNGELENTIVIVTSDNGMPFPNGKSNLYTLGTAVPLAVMWKGKIEPGRVVDDLINLGDLAPTILQLCGLPVPEEMTAKSFADILLSDKEGLVDPTREFTVMGQDVHDSVYPMRAIRTQDYLYILNIEPERTKEFSGSAPWQKKEIASEKRSQFEDLRYGNYYGSFRNDPVVKPWFDSAFGKRPAEELYELKKDPFQIHNVANQPQFADLKAKLKSQMIDYLVQTGDPRFTGGPVKFTEYAPVVPDSGEYKGTEVPVWKVSQEQIAEWGKVVQQTYREMKLENKKRAAQTVN